MGVWVWVCSVPAALQDLLTRRTHCDQDGVGQRLRMSDGRMYTPFRHTIKDPAYWARNHEPAVLQPRFHLHFLSPNRRRLHALFRVVCIMTTPFFVGLPGFRSKLWMVDPATGDFAGLYEWDDAATAYAYAEGLAKVLLRLSIPNSVSYQLQSGVTVTQYLDAAERRAA
jgi:hypothetical protein